MDHLLSNAVSIFSKKRYAHANIARISVVSCAAFFFVTLFQCNPISYFWNTSTQEGTCVNIEIVIALGYLYSVFSIISDFTFAILPAFIVMTLQLKLRTKIALIPLLAMGCMSVLYLLFLFRCTNNPSVQALLSSRGYHICTSSDRMISCGRLLTLQSGRLSNKA